jgi:outer membrane protein assembly factor BamA
VFARQVAACLLASLCLTTQANAQQGEPLPTFEQLEAEGAIIGQILIDNQNIFDLEDPEENNIFFRAANALHIRTRKGVIQRIILFKSGEPVSVQLIEETERLLQNRPYIYEVFIRPIAYRDGVVDVEVLTRDTWTLDPGLGYSRQGGENTSKYGLKELNLLGTGAAIEWQREEAERGTTDEYQFNNDLLLGTRARFNITYVDSYTGTAQFVSLVRPFFQLDGRWAAGVSASSSDSLATTYSENVVTSQYRRQDNRVSVFGGLSKGLVNGWTRRYNLGVDFLEEKNELVGGAPPPDQLPIDETRVSPFVRFEVIQDKFVKTTNRNQIQRPEFFLLGFAADVKLGYGATELGSTRSSWNYTASINQGWDLSRDRILVVQARAGGLYTEGDDENQLLTGEVQYFVPQSNRAQSFVGLAVDAASDIATRNQLSLGGENGLAGYPANYQTGDRRVLFNLEQRLYSDWYPFRLFRVGGGAFLDVGRAWGGDETLNEDPGVLASAGFGLRLFSVRSAFGTVWRLDIAFPIDPQGDVPSYQIQFYRTVGF